MLEWQTTFYAKPAPKVAKNQTSTILISVTRSSVKALSVSPTERAGKELTLIIEKIIRLKVSHY